MTIIVYHSGYGCETGCCGHRIELKHADGESRESFVFGHASPGDERDYAEKIVREEFGAQHVADLDWENCRVLNYDECDS